MATAAKGTPTLHVPSCKSSKTGHISYANSAPPGSDFPTTHVDLCYSDTDIQIAFTARDEESFFFNASQKTNDFIFFYEVMEVFMATGLGDPSTYFELDISPNNVTFTTMVYNPSKNLTTGAPYDHFVIPAPIADGITAKTQLDKPGHVWRSQVNIPLALFNVEKGQAKGSAWRMNFFRTVTNSTYFPKQLFGAWNPPDTNNLHNTPYFGKVYFD